MDCNTPGFPVHHQLPELAQTHVRQVSDAIQLSHPLSSSSPSAFNLSQHQSLFQWVSASHQSPKYWRFSLSISPSNEFSALISFRTDWFDLLADQTLKDSPKDRSTPGFPIHHQLQELTQTYVHRVSDAIQPSYPLSSPLLLPSIFPSIRVYFNESVLRIRWPGQRVGVVSISSSNEYSRQKKL